MLDIKPDIKMKLIKMREISSQCSLIKAVNSYEQNLQTPRNILQGRM